MNRFDSSQTGVYRIFRRFLEVQGCTRLFGIRFRNAFAKEGNTGMARSHAWFAAATALASTTWMVVSVIGAPPVSSEPPVVQLLAPVFDDLDDVEAPAPASSLRGRATVGPNRPLGLGFPGKVSQTKTRSRSLPIQKSEIQPVQGTAEPGDRLELPVVELSTEDPPPPGLKTENLRTTETRQAPEPDALPQTESPETGEPKATPMPESGFDEIAPLPSEAPSTNPGPTTSRPILMREMPSDLAGASGFSPPYLPANQDPDALPWTSGFQDRAARAPDVEDVDVSANVLSDLPTDYVPWWLSELPHALRVNKTEVPVDVDILVTGALQFAPQVLGIRTQPDINNSILCAENAAFDWTAFVESKWSDLSDPVGNKLTTGNGSRRFIDQIYTNQAGLRRKNEYGGQFEVSQKVGWQDNNSANFIPKPQGTTRLQMNYTQPLLNGSGVAYNQARIVLAQIELNRSFDVVQEEIQDHLVKVTEAYWDLYRSRVIYLQRRRVYDRAQYILETLGGREEVDALQRQVNRAKAAVASRRSEIVRAQSAIRNAESRLRLLVNDPQYLDLSTIELVPIESPRVDHMPLSLSGSLQQALQYRPDISQAVHDLRAAGVRIGVSQNELLPKLDLVLSTYVAGLAGNHDILKAWGNQYADGRPGYTSGLQFEMPLGNRAAKARLDRRQWELTKAVYDFRTVVETGLTDVELSVREAETSYLEMLGKFQLVIAAETESSYLEDRWKVLPGGDRGTTLLLEDLLDAQQRQADAEGEFVQSQVAYSIALIRVRRAMGVLLIAQNPTRYAEPTSDPVHPDEIPSARVTVPEPETDTSETAARPFPPFSNKTESTLSNKSPSTASKRGVPHKPSSPPGGGRTTRLSHNDEIWSRR